MEHLKGKVLNYNRIQFLEELGLGIEIIFMVNHDFLRFSYVVTIE